MAKYYFLSKYILLGLFKFNSTSQVLPVNQATISFIHDPMLVSGRQGK